MGSEGQNYDPSGHAIDVDTPVSVVIGPVIRSVYRQ